jgi:MFS transporter, DHA1 family, multidrug resistance protein
MPDTFTPARRFELLLLLGLMQAIAPVSIDMYLPAMPQMEQVFHVSAAAIESTMVTFLIGFALGQLLYGPLTDRFGRKPPLYVSLGLFTIASAACAFAPNIGVMSGLRLIQAIGACGGSVISRAIVRDVFPAREMRRVFSMLILVLGVSPILAPLLGSYLLLWFGWQAAFLAQATVGALLLIAIHFRLRESMPPNSGRDLSWSSVAAAYGKLIEDRTFLGASAVCGFSAAGAFAYIASAPFVFMSVYKVPTEHFGWLFGSVAAGMVAASQVNGRLPHRIPVWRILRTANLIQLAVALLLFVSVRTGFGGLPLVYFAIFLFIAAQGFVFPNGSTIAMMRHANMAGTASAMLGTTQYLIAALGTGLLGYLGDPASAMATVILGSAVISTTLNYFALGRRLEEGAAP